MFRSIRITGQIILLLFLIFFESYAKDPSIKRIEPLDFCIGETVTIYGTELRQVAHIVFNEVNLFQSSGDFQIVNDKSITFTAPAAAVTNGPEIVTTTIFIGIYGFFPADRQDNWMSVNPLPAEAKNPVSSVYCQGEEIKPVRVNDPGPDYRIDWFENESGGNILFTGISFLPPAAGTYYAEVVSLVTGCSSDRIAVTSREMPAPSPPSGATDSQYCQGDPVTSVSVDDPGEGFLIKWYPDADGGDQIGSGRIYTPPGPGTYYAARVNVENSCSSLSRTQATVVRNPVPPTPSGPMDAFFCGSDPVPPVSVNNPGKGFTVYWYRQASGATMASGTTSGQNGEIFTPLNSISATYFAEIENDQTGCISPSRTAVTIEKNPEGCLNTDFSSYYFEEQESQGTIDLVSHSIEASVIYGTSISNLIASFSLPEKAVARVAGIVQKSGVTPNDFSKPVTYTVTAADGVTRQSWDVTVSVIPNQKAEILSFSFPEQTKNAVIDKKNRLITIEVIVWTDITRLIADFTLSAGAVAYVGDQPQDSGTTINDFTKTVTFRVVAQDGSTSENWQIRVNRQDIKDDLDPVIVSSEMPDVYPMDNDSISASAVIRDNIGVSHVVLRYKKYQDSLWKEMIIRSADSVYSTFISDTLIGEHGMHYYLKAYDFKNNADSTGVVDMVIRYTQENSPEISGLKFGGEVVDYQIVSIPLFLEDNSVENVFDELMPYDIKRWRLFHYSGGLTGEYGKSFKSLVPGQGYWLIVREPVRINTGAGITNRIINGGYALSLVPGWNQIGNPYSFDISWDEVILYNGFDGLNRLKTYDNGVLSESNILPAFGGGFVFSDEEQTLHLVVPPYPGNKNARTAEDELYSREGNDGAGNWFLPLSIGHGKFRNDLYGIGMHAGSENEFDRYDEPVLPVPSEISGFDMYFLNPGQKFEKLARDIVPLKEEHMWEFEIISHGNEDDLILKWNSAGLEKTENDLILIDDRRSRVVDMLKTDSYSFQTPGRSSLRIFYGPPHQLAGKILPIMVHLGEIYPNPFSQKVKIPIALPDNDEIFEVKVVITDLSGRKIYESHVEKLMGGFHEISLELDPSQGDAVNIFQVIVSSSSNLEVLSRKMLKSIESR